MSTPARPQSQQTPTTAPARLRGPRRGTQVETPLEGPRYVDLGNGSRFEFALVGLACAVMWASLVAAIISL